MNTTQRIEAIKTQTYNTYRDRLIESGTSVEEAAVLAKAHMSELDAQTKNLTDVSN